DPADALGWLDAGIARAPRLAELRWERARRRLEAGRVTDARVDFQELEALARGARDRHDVLRRAGDVYRAVGLGGDAAILYERALLYRPDDPAALAGLGASLAAEGRMARGAAVLAHAIDLAEARGLPFAWMLLELGRVLGERLGDRPAAVARLRDIPDEAPEAIDARGLEGRLRAQLGDAAGASLAYARMRERAGAERRSLPWLVEAARFEEERGNREAAQRHLAVAVSIAPNEAALEAQYREVGLRIAQAAGIRATTAARADAWRRDYEERPVTIEEREAPSSARVLPPIESESLDDGPTIALNGPLEPPAPPPATEQPRERSLVDLGAGADDEPLGDAEDEARVESLTRTLQGNPSDDAVVDELVTLLSRLGRSMDLLALLSARLEDAPPDRREALLPRHREVLATLEREARAAGREMEADLFRMSREAAES
ncbi:MAG: domain protein putative component of TonB system, partial [Labilithrix sp.]|nr:domain protein putative component of TonB system [Labilithrix sp.]